MTNNNQICLIYICYVAALDNIAFTLLVIIAADN